MDKQRNDKQEGADVLLHITTSHIHERLQQNFKNLTENVSYKFLIVI